MSRIDDFKDAERCTRETTLQEPFGKKVGQLADSDIGLQPSDRARTPYPPVYWGPGQCRFGMVETGDRRDRFQFYDRLHDPLGTGAGENDDLTECVVPPLRARPITSVALLNNRKVDRSLIRYRLGREAGHRP